MVGPLGIGAGKTALIVDDSKAMLLRASLMLKKHGFKTITMSEGLDALEVPAKERVDIIILDIEMPGMDGYQLCDRFRERPECTDIPILFLTARNDYLDRLKGFSAGGQAYITKEFIESAFLEAVTKLIAGEKT
ncbi:MAG: response regulator [Planctomycetes bacterium]|nr:response regulator [Planctomycetota bacterium]